MSDIVERARTMALPEANELEDLLYELVDEIERLRKERSELVCRENDRLVAALTAALDQIERLRLQVNALQGDLAEEEARYERLRQEMVTQFEQADYWRVIAREDRTEVERLRAALCKLSKDPEPNLDEPDLDWEVVVKMRQIARAALGGL